MPDQIASLYAKIGADPADFNKAMKGVKDDLTSTQKGFASFQSVVTTGFKAVGIAAAAAFAGLAAGLTSSIKAAANFEQGIADTSAAMSLSADEAAKLEKHIMDLGLNPGLKVSATEAQAAIHSLGTAGLSMTQILGGASEATVLLANATGGEFADSAALMTDVMGQFNIKAEDASQIVNQLTGLTVASKFSFNDAALAFAQVGGAAGAFGVSLEDTNAILGVTSNMFASGSDAGTSFKTFLTTLIPKSNEAADAMAALGLETIDYARMAEYLSGVLGEEVEPSINGVFEAYKKTKIGMDLAEVSQDKLAKGFNALRAQYGENQFFDDTTGAMKSAEEIAGTLKTAFGDLSEAQRNEALTTIFGTDAMRTAIGLIRGGTPAVTAFKDEVAKVDAGEMASKRMNTFSGALEIAQGIIETLSISIGQQFLPMLRPLVEQFSELAQKHGPAVIKFFGGLSEATAGIIQKMMDWSQNTLLPLFERLTQIGIAVWKVAQLVTNAIKPVADAIGKWVSWKDILIAVGILLTGAVVAAIFSFMAAMSPVILLVAKVTAVIAILREAWEHNFLGIRDITNTILNNISKWLDTHTGLWKGDWGKTLNFMVNHAGEAWKEIWREAVHLWSVIKSEVTRIVSTWIGDLINWIEYYISTTYFALRSWLVRTQRIFTDIKEWALEKLQQILDFFIPREWQEKGKAIIQGLWDGAKQIWQGFKDWWSRLWAQLTGTVDVKLRIGSPSKEMMERGKAAVEGFAIGAQQAMPVAVGAMGSLAGVSMGSASSAPSVSTSRIEELLTILIAELRAKNMSVTVQGGGGTSYSEAVAFRSGLR